MPFRLPDRDFDPIEAGVTWKKFTGAGHVASFATPFGNVASADPLLISGAGLDPWARIPFLDRFRAFGAVSRERAVEASRSM